MLQTQNIRRVHRSSHSTSTPSRPKNIDDHDPNSKSKDAPIKVILSLFGLLIVVFIMFSVFQPKKNRPPDRPPLKVFYDKQKFRNEHSEKQNNIAPNIPIKDILKDDHNPFNADSIAKDESSENLRDESADIEFIDSGNAEEHSMEHQDISISDDIEDLYSKPSIPPRPPQSIHIDGLSTDEIREFWTESLNEKDLFDASNVPGADSNGLIYIMNYIFLPYEQMMSIFLLTSEYLDPNHGLHAWPSKRRRDDVPQLYKNIRDTIYKEYKLVSPTFACVFRVKGHLWVSKVDFVPNNTTRDRYVNYGTEILRCNVPMKDINKYSNVGDSPFYDEEYEFEFLLTQKWQHLLSKTDQEQQERARLVHVSLSFMMGMRSGIKLYGYDDALMFEKANQKRYLTLCMPPMSEPLSFISENIAHYVSNIGIEHIYIGTFFEWDKVEEYREKLIERLQPWYDRGLITIWPHEQPWIGFTDKAKSHWLNQCLYYVKSRDTYTISLDADEFLVLNKIEDVYKEHTDQEMNDEQFKVRAALMQSVFSEVLKDRIDEFDEDHYCWLTFQSWQVWNLVHQNESYMIRRFIGRESRAQLTWSKAIWNNKHLHYTGYHAGGACSAQNHDWTQIVYDWREQKDPKHVYRFNPEDEGALLHYYNCRQIRIEPKDRNLRNPWSKLVNDTRMMDIYWQNIENEFGTHKLVPTFPDASDVMNTKYYRTHYGFGNNMAIWKNPKVVP